MKQHLMSDTSYSIVNSTDFINTQIISHLRGINEEAGIQSAPTMFGKYMKVEKETKESVKDVPTNKYIIVSLNNRSSEEFVKIDVSSILVPLCAEIMGETNTDFIKYCNKYLRWKKADIVYYYMSALVFNAIDNKGSFNVQKADLVLRNYEYQGQHTVTEKYQILIEFIEFPNEENLFDLLAINNGNFGGIIGIVGKIVEDGVPDWLKNRIENNIEGKVFTQNLLTIAIGMLKTDDYEDFVLYLIHNVINKK